MDSNCISIFDFASGEETSIRLKTTEGGHGGGDSGIVGSFLEEVRSYNGGESLSSVSASV